MVDDLERQHCFEKQTLKSIVPARPAVQQAALYDERVDEDCERSRAGGKPDTVDSSELFAARVQQMRRLVMGVPSLGGKPACERLAVIMEDHAGERQYAAGNYHPLGVALVSVMSLD